MACLLSKEQVRIGVFPAVKECLVLGARLCGLFLPRQYARQVKVRERVGGPCRLDPRMRQNQPVVRGRLVEKPCCCFCPCKLPGHAVVAQLILAGGSRSATAALGLCACRSSRARNSGRSK